MLHAAQNQHACSILWGNLVGTKLYLFAGHFVQTVHDLPDGAQLAAILPTPSRSLRPRHE